MMKHLIILLFLVFSWESSFSQQLPHFSQYMLNGYLINPAVAGSENYGDVKVGYRHQWTGIEGAPESYYMTAHMPIGKLNLNTTATSFPLRENNSDKALYREYREGSSGKIVPHHGVGLTLISDEAGALRRSDFRLTYAYHLPVGKNIKMAAGISLGVAYYNVDQSKLYLSNPDDPAFLTYNHLRPTISTGLLMYSPRFFVGLTAAQLFQNKMSAPAWGSREPASTQCYLTGGYKIQLSPKFSVLPSTLIKYLQPVAFSADANLKFLYDNRIWLGGSYRNKDAVVLMGGINFNNLLQISYAYDLASAGISMMGRGSHELVLGLLLNNKGKVFSPSDFW